MSQRRNRKDTTYETKNISCKIMMQISHYAMFFQKTAEGRNSR